MTKYIIASSQCEALLTTKEAWDNSNDDYLRKNHEFEASSWEEAVKIYENYMWPKTVLGKKHSL